MQKARVEINAEQRQSDDADSVLDYDERKDQPKEHNDLPRRSKVEVRGENAGNEERNARPNSATFGRYLDCHAGKRQHKALTKNRHAEEIKEAVSYVGRSFLENADGPCLRGFGQRNCEDKKEQRKPRSSGDIGTIDEDESANPYDDKSQRHRG